MYFLGGYIRFLGSEDEFQVPTLQIIRSCLYLEGCSVVVFVSPKNTFGELCGGAIMWLSSER